MRGFHKGHFVEFAVQTSSDTNRQPEPSRAHTEAMNNNKNASIILTDGQNHSFGYESVIIASFDVTLKIGTTSRFVFHVSVIHFHY